MIHGPLGIPSVENQGFINKPDFNISTFDLALSSHAEVFVPGHGRAGGQEVAEIHREYLSRLKSEIAKHFDEDMSDFEMKPLVIESMAAFSNRVDFERNIGRSINLAYLEVEGEPF